VEQQHDANLVLQHSLQFAEIGGRLNVVEEKQRDNENATVKLADEVRRLSDTLLTVESERKSEQSFRRWATPIVVSVVVGIVSSSIPILLLLKGP